MPPVSRATGSFSESFEIVSVEPVSGPFQLVVADIRRRLFSALNLILEIVEILSVDGLILSYPLGSLGPRWNSCPTIESHT